MTNDLHEHEHHHEHHHEHEHHHDHDHEHEHHHHEMVEITEHEGALIGSVKGRMAGNDYDIAKEKLTVAAKEAARRITETGGIIGHIKFILAVQGQACRISITEEEPSFKEFEGPDTDIEGAAIVFNVEEETLEEILEETVGALLIRQEMTE